MAIKFLDDITLESNEIQDVAVENVSSDPTGFAGRIIYNTTTTTLKYYNGTAWVSLDGTGNVDSVIGSGGLLDVTTGQDVDIRPDYTTTNNIIKSASGSGTLIGSSTMIANVSNAVGEYSLGQIATVINGELSGITVIGNSGSESVEDGDTLAFVGGSYITTIVAEPTAGSTTATFNHDNTTRSDSTSTSTPAAGGTIAVVTSVTTNTTGHLSAINVETITLPIAGTMSSFDVDGDASGTTAQTISNGNTLQINGDGSYIDTLAVDFDILRVRHLLSGVTAAAYTYPTSVTVNAAGHITAITGGSAPGTMDSWTLNYGAAGSSTTATIADGDSVTMRIYQSSYKGLFLQNPSANVQNVGLDLTLVDTVTAIDATNDFLTVAVTDATSGSGNNAKILASNISLSQFAVPTADLSMGTNKVTNVVDPTNAQDAATKQYVDDSVVGGLVYQGGYNASTNSPALSGASNIALTKGWVYTVIVAGTFIGTAVEIGDVIIVETDIAANSNPPVTDFTIVQRNVDLATNTVAGIASFPTTNGFATMTGGAAKLAAGAAVSAIGSASETVTITTDAFGKVTAATEQNIAIATSQVTGFDAAVDVLIEATQFKANIGNGSATSYVVNHALNTRDVIVQVYDNTTYETVQCKVVRTDVNNVTISTAAAAINAGLRVVIQSLQ
jgi:hypothetical protein